MPVNQRALRSPTLYYAYFLLSGGLFIFVWTYILMIDTNRAYRRNVFPARTISLITLSLFLFGIGLILLSIWSGRGISREIVPLILLPLFTAELIVFFAIPVAVYNAVISLGDGHGRARDSSSIVLKMFALGLGLPFLQKRLNLAIRDSTH